MVEVLRNIDHAAQPVRAGGPLGDGKRVVVCLGAGGVGKTTTAAALGLALAQAGRRVLVLTIDPSPRLMTALGFEEAPGEPTRLPDASLARLAAPLKGELYAQTLDRRALFDSLIREVAGSSAAEGIFGNRLYEYVASTLAGVHELMAVEQMYRLYRSGRFDTIVLDTPPLVNAYDFLEAPRKVLSALDNKVSQWLVGEREQDEERVVGAKARLARWALSRFTGEAFLGELIELIRALRSVFAGFREHAADVERIFAAQDTAFLVVSRPVDAALESARAALAYLEAEGLACEALLINAVSAESLTPPPSAAALEAERAAWFALDAFSDAAIARLSAADARLRARAQAERERLAHLIARNDGLAPDLLVAPELERDVRTLDDIERIGRSYAPLGHPHGLSLPEGRAR